jgi:hypothetical protein
VERKSSVFFSISRGNWGISWNLFTIATPCAKIETQSINPSLTDNLHHAAGYIKHYNLTQITLHNAICKFSPQEHCSFLQLWVSRECNSTCRKPSLNSLSLTSCRVYLTANIVLTCHFRGATDCLKFMTHHLPLLETAPVQCSDLAIAVSLFCHLHPKDEH